MSTCTRVLDRFTSAVSKAKIRLVHRLNLISRSRSLQSDPIQNLPAMCGGIDETEKRDNNTHPVVAAFRPRDVIESSDLSNPELKASTDAAPKGLKRLIFSILRNLCRPSCVCTCHKCLTSNQSEKDLESLRPKCNELQCKRRQSRQTKIVWCEALLWRNKFEQLVARCGLRMHRYLRMHSIVPSTFDAVKFAETGNHMGLYELLQHKKASIWDEESDGWSYLIVSRFLIKSDLIDDPKTSTYYKRRDCVKLLLFKYGADASATDEDGR